MTDELVEEVAEAIAEKAKVILTEVRGYVGTLVYEPMLANEDEIAQAAIDALQKHYEKHNAELVEALIAAQCFEVNRVVETNNDITQAYIPFDTYRAISKWLDNQKKH